MGKLEAALLTGQARGRSSLQRQTASSTRTMLVSDVQGQIEGLRLDVQDAAGAVLSWAAAVSGNADHHDLALVLQRCLRPGPDVTKVCYAAMSREIQRVTGVALTPKRVQTAVRHLRRQRRQALGDHRSPANRVEAGHDASTRFETLRHRILESDGQTLSALSASDLAVSILAEVRSAVSRLTPYDYTGSDRDALDRQELDDRRDHFEMYRGVAAAGGAADRTAGLLSALETHGDTALSDMQLVVTGAAVVHDLAGETSLPGLLASLNVAVAGRELIRHSVYVGAMVGIADDAQRLHDDAVTRRLIRRHAGDAACALPRPRRLASFALNNAATRILHRSYTGDLLGHESLDLADRLLTRMEQGDSGFELLAPTRALAHVVRAVHPGLDKAAQRDAELARDAWLTAKGTDGCLKMLMQLARHESCRSLVNEVRICCQQVHPDLVSRFIHL